jgi:hypothetical protein
MAAPLDNTNPVDETDHIDDTWPRFAAHWLATTLGFFLRSLLPVIQSWTNPEIPVDYPRWWAALIFAAVISILGGGVNSNLPVKPRELLKSVALGFALDSATVLAKIGPFVT